MNKGISLQELVAVNNTPKANALIIQYGYAPAKNIDDLVGKLKDLTRDYREEGLMQLASLHPHKDLILHASSDESKSNACGGGYSNACGCSGADGSASNNHGKGCRRPECKGYSNFEYAEDYIDFTGKKSQNDPMQQLQQYLPLIIVAGIFALGITAMNKKA